MVDDIINTCEESMKNAVEAFSLDLAKVPTGSASAAFLDDIKVDYYGTPTPVSQVATVVLVDPRLITVKPWETSMVGVIAKAIRDSGLGIDPIVDSALIRLALPPLTLEDRKLLVKKVMELSEEPKIAVR